MYKFTEFLKISHSNLLSKPFSMKMGYGKNRTSYYCMYMYQNLQSFSKFKILHGNKMTKENMKTTILN